MSCPKPCPNHTVCPDASVHAPLYLHLHCFCQTVWVSRFPGLDATTGGAVEKHKQCCVCGDRKIPLLDG